MLKEIKIKALIIYDPFVSIEKASLLKFSFLILQIWWEESVLSFSSQWPSHLPTRTELLSLSPIKSVLKSQDYFITHPTTNSICDLDVSYFSKIDSINGIQFDKFVTLMRFKFKSFLLECVSLTA